MSIQSQPPDSPSTSFESSSKAEKDAVTSESGICNCCICLNDFAEKYIIRLACEHIICKECFQLYIHNLIPASKVEAFICPFHECSSKLSLDLIRQSISKRLLAEFDKFLLEEYFERNKVWVPYLRDDVLAFFSNEASSSKVASQHCEANNKEAFDNYSKHSDHKKTDSEEQQNESILDEEQLSWNLITVKTHLILNFNDIRKTEDAITWFASDVIIPFVGYVWKTHLVGKLHQWHHKKEFLSTYRVFDTHFGYRHAKSDYFDHSDLDDYWGNDILRDLKEFFDKFSHIEDHDRRVFAEMLAALDAVGEIFEELANSNEVHNTIILFTSDNGGTPNGR
ncbi:arylsulfatase B-like isoform X2, partial [Dinothrombium tinctorium]